MRWLFSCRDVARLSLVVVCIWIAWADQSSALTLRQSIERKFPVVTSCPLPDRGQASSLSFVADSSRIRLTLGRQDVAGQCDGLSGAACADSEDCPSGETCATWTTLITNVAILRRGVYDETVDPDGDGVPDLISELCYTGCDPGFAPEFCAPEMPASSLPTGPSAIGDYSDDAVGTCPAGWTCDNAEVRSDSWSLSSGADFVTANALQLGVVSIGSAEAFVDVGDLEEGVEYVVYIEWTVQNMSNEGDSVLDVGVDSLPCEPPGTGPEICRNGVDDDCNGLTDIGDPTCGPTGPMQLAFTDANTLTWNMVSEADHFAVYRGRLAFGSAQSKTPGEYRCFLSEVAGASATIDEVPLVGEANFYLVTAQQITASGAISETSTGTTSSGESRAPGAQSLCGQRVFADGSGTGPFTGRSWSQAYRTIDEALNHPEARDRSVEVWVKGEITGPASQLTMEGRTHAIVRGGFAGVEAAAWERNADSNPSTWSGDGRIVLGTSQGLVIDGLTMKKGVYGERIEYFEAVDCAVESTVSTNRKIEIRMTGFDFAAPLPQDLLTEIWIDRCVFREAGVELQASPGELRGRVSRSRFESQGLDLEIGNRLADDLSAEGHFDVVNNAFRAGAPISVFVMGKGGVDGLFTGTISGNIVEGRGPATEINRGVSLSAELRPVTETFPEPQPFVFGILDVTVTGNTITGWREALSCTPAVNLPLPATPDVGATICRLRAWNNLITSSRWGLVFRPFSDGNRCNEFAGECASAVLDLEVNGNDVFGSTVSPLYWYERQLTSVAEMNALDGFSDNIDVDPLYADMIDYTLQPQSPVIDLGDPNAPGWMPVDANGNTRIRDGDGDGVARPDLGAKER